MRETGFTLRGVGYARRKNVRVHGAGTAPLRVHAGNQETADAPHILPANSPGENRSKIFLNIFPQSGYEGRTMFLSKAKKKSAWVQTALERFERPLLQYALSILQDLDRAKDTVQETFMRLHTQDQAAIEGHLSPWLFTVCRNCALKSLKKEDRYIYVEHEEFEHRRVDNVSPLQEMSRRETVERLMKHVKGLPKNQQEVVRLRFHGSHSYLEISQITGLSVGNVGFILNAAMRNLRGKMERDDKDEKIIYLAKRAAS
jgi:RNA polymerase sigma-70 factor (ECF subfamily)